MRHDFQPSGPQLLDNKPRGILLTIGNMVGRVLCMGRSGPTGEIKKVERGNGNSENHHIKVNYVYIMYSAVFVKRDDN